MCQLPAIRSQRLRVTARDLLQRIGGAEPHERSLRAQGGNQRRHNRGIACRTPNDSANLAHGAPIAAVEKRLDARLFVARFTACSHALPFTAWNVAPHTKGG